MGLALRLLTWNIRHGDDAGHAHPWIRRRTGCLAWLRQAEADLIALQEVRDDTQGEAVRTALPGHGFVGLRRGLAHAAECEMTPLYYRQSAFDLVEASHFWLSATPHLFGSSFHGAGFARMATWAALRARAGGQIFTIFNLHADHVRLEGQRIQAESAALLRRRIEALGPEMPVLLCADFNAERGGPAWNTLMAAGGPGYMQDLAAELPGTAHGFGAAVSPATIDWILASRHWRRLEAAVPKPRQEGYVSDHEPIEVRVELGPPANSRVG